jgi:hypothetical protein
VVYCEAELDASAMALGSLGYHAPVSVERRGNCGRSETDGCGSGRQSDGADTIADHGESSCLISSGNFAESAFTAFGIVSVRKFLCRQFDKGS